VSARDAAAEALESLGASTSAARLRIKGAIEMLEELCRPPYKLTRRVWAVSRAIRWQRVARIRVK
jgi:uncharacterized protein (UPF0147 family)